MVSGSVNNPALLNQCALEYYGYAAKQIADKAPSSSNYRVRDSTDLASFDIMIKKAHY